MPSPLPFALPPTPLAGAVVVVTGASRGLGAGLAARFGAHGAALGLCARTVPSPPVAAGAHAEAVDVSDAEAVDRFARAVTRTLGPIDLWINNAGVLEPIGPQRDHDPAEVARALSVNVGGVANGTRSFTRLAARAPGRAPLLVNISSGAARSTYAGWSVYGACKAAVDHFTEVVAVEEPGIRCHAVAPGVVETDMQARIRGTDEAVFPAVGRFRQIHVEGSASTPAWVADHLTALFLGALVPDQVVYRVPPEHP